MIQQPINPRADLRKLYARNKPLARCSCQVSKWGHYTEESLSFMTEQLTKAGRPYEIRRSRNGMISVWSTAPESLGKPARWKPPATRRSSTRPVGFVPLDTLHLRWPIVN